MKKLNLLIAIIVIATLNCAAQYTKLLDFDSINGGAPNSYLISDGTFLYGMTQFGGKNNDGTIFKIKTRWNQLYQTFRFRQYKRK
jgi:uncharacterized repeat protein (TIGR03803 family)